MSTNRVEAFSDGVIAIIVTIMVLELQAPHQASLGALARLAPVFLAYVLSFLVVAIMWVNHHHLLHAAQHADARLLWTNNLLLFWMSLIPFVTRYLGANPKASFAVAIYGAVLAMCAASFTLLRHAVNQHHRDDPTLADYNQRMLRKSVVSTTLYAASAPLAYVSVYLSFLIFVLIPALYFLPERKLAESKTERQREPIEPGA
ncbi:MAG TPA: TMEM175 family protein [Terriglobia bacterium]|nr:TMEM175 family protein [Terriglobia bacterium]